MILSFVSSVLKVRVKAAADFSLAKITQLDPKRRYSTPDFLAQTAILRSPSTIPYSMTKFDDEFKLAANPGPNRKIPGAVLLAADRSGMIVAHRY